MALAALCLGTIVASATAVSGPLETCGTLSSNFILFGSPEVPPIPPGFFGPGSDPFFGSVLYTGVELDPHNLGTASVRMQWPIDPVPPAAPPGAQGTVPIEIVALSLVSVQPITVTYNGGQNPQHWDVGITLSTVHPPQGTMHAVKTHSNGGTFDSQFFVQPTFMFAKVEPPFDVRILDTGEFALPPFQMSVVGAPFVHNVNPLLHVIPPGPGSVFVPGVQQTVPGNINSQVLAPFSAHTPLSFLVHTVCPAVVKLSRCEVVSKSIPSSQVACNVINNADGTVTIRDEVYFEAEFRANCACCEYRQSVKGEFKLNGKKVNHVLEAGVNLEKNVYHEDGFGDPPAAGSNPHYGHRGDPNNPDHDRYSNPGVRGAGCSYSGNDGPGWYGIDPGDTYSTELQFVSVIEDICNQVSLLPAHSWSVSCNGVALSPGPDPLYEVVFATTLAGRGALLGVYLYPGNVLTIVGSVSNGMGEVPIDSSQVIITALGLLPLSTPGPGPLPDTSAGSSTAQALYNFAYPPGSPNPVSVNFMYLGQPFNVNVTIPQPCLGDIDGNGTVDVVDFLALLGSWGPCAGCPADLNGDGQVSVVDFLALLGNWGPCP